MGNCLLSTTQPLSSTRFCPTEEAFRGTPRYSESFHRLCCPYCLCAYTVGLVETVLTLATGTSTVNELESCCVLGRRARAPSTSSLPERSSVACRSRAVRNKFRLSGSHRLSLPTESRVRSGVQAAGRGRGQVTGRAGQPSPGSGLRSQVEPASSVPGQIRSSDGCSGPAGSPFYA